MFTMRDFHKIKTGIKGLEPEMYFSPTLNKIAYTISLGSPYSIGQCGEKLMARCLRQKKMKVKRYGAKHPFDLLVNNTIKCEVKTAKMFKKGYKHVCVFSDIKPECFDILFMVFITPNGIITKWTEQKYVERYTNNLVRQKDGYYIYFDGTCDNENLAYDDDINNFVKLYANPSPIST